MMYTKTFKEERNLLNVVFRKSYRNRNVLHNGNDFKYSLFVYVVEFIIINL